MQTPNQYQSVKHFHEEKTTIGHVLVLLLGEEAGNWILHLGQQKVLESKCFQYC